MNSYKTECGERVSESTIKRNIRKAKELKKDSFLKHHKYIFCEFTGKNAIAGIIDIMHIISVDECKKSGRTNLAWDQRNLKFGLRWFHQNFDCLPHSVREAVFQDFENFGSILDEAKFIY